MRIKKTEITAISDTLNSVISFYIYIYIIKLKTQRYMIQRRIVKKRPIN
jgi:hypothetical protein